MPITRPYSIIKKVKNLLVNVKITVSCEQRCLQPIFQQKWPLKHCCGNRFSKTIIAILLNHLHFCPSMPLLYLLFYLYLLSMFWAVIFMLSAVWWQFPLLEFWQISWHSSFNFKIKITLEWFSYDLEKWFRQVVVICFISQWMKRWKHGIFVFPPKETLIWRRHCSIGQLCCSMTSKRSIDWFLARSRVRSYFTRAFA